MVNTIWLIPEGQNEEEIVKAILKKDYPHINVIRIKQATPKPSIEQLAYQLEEFLLPTAKKRRGKGDCIVVLHDADIQTNPNRREAFERIARICKQHKDDVYHVVAYDSIESWLLADTAFCAWLEIAPKNWDEQPKPKKYLTERLDKLRLPKYSLENIGKILSHVDGTGAKYSPSLQKALDHLQTAPCNLDKDS